MSDSEVVIRVENLGKRYRIGAREEGYKTFREAVTDIALAPIKRLRDITRLSRFRDDDRSTTFNDVQRSTAFNDSNDLNASTCPVDSYSTGTPSTLNGSNALNGRPSDDDTIWALKDVSFEAKRGDVLGIIGRNGAGKTSLLKILSRITDPTEGRVRIKGLVASLLEVGTGFHPELTGRENIFLNGAILGMSRAEIQKNFDEIVAFAEVERFIDTPVKRYSSGMYVRLAFAVAAHLDPEILLVDEVLAVGDVAFQKKCLGKMGDVATEGRTVLFVSHNMAAVQALCPRSILLKDGQVHRDGVTAGVLTHYLADSQNMLPHNKPGEYGLLARRNPYSDGKLMIRKVQLLNHETQPRETFAMGQMMHVQVFITGLGAFRGAEVGVVFKSGYGQWITGITSGMTCSSTEQPRQENECATLTIPRLPFTPGRLSIDVALAQPGIGRLDYVEDAAVFQVVEVDVYGTGRAVSAYFGVVYLDADWQIRGAEDGR